MKIKEKKQVAATQNQGQVETIKKYSYDNKDTPLISKYKEIFNEHVDERRVKIIELHENVNSDNSIYRYKFRTADAKFQKFDNALSFIDKVREGEISLTDVKNNQAKYKSNLGEVKKHPKI